MVKIRVLNISTVKWVEIIFFFNQVNTTALIRFNGKLTNYYNLFDKYIFHILHIIFINNAHAISLFYSRFKTLFE